MKAKRGEKSEMILSFVVSHPDSTIPEISEALDFCPSHVSVRLKVFAVMGVVERRTVLSKRRSHPWVNIWRAVDGSQ